MIDPVDAALEVLFPGAHAGLARAWERERVVKALEAYEAAKIITRPSADESYTPEQIKRHAQAQTTGESVEVGGRKLTVDEIRGKWQKLDESREVGKTRKRMHCGWCGGDHPAGPSCDNSGRRT